MDIEVELLNHLPKRESIEFLLKEGLNNELIYTPQVRSVYNFVQHHFNDTGKVPSLAVLDHEYPNITFVEPETTIEYVVDKLKLRYQKNQIQELTVELAKQHADPEQAMKYLRGEVFKIERNSLSQQHIYSSTDYNIFIHNVQEKILKGAYRGASIGFKDIDDFTGGIKDGNVAYILARPKRKKSFFILNSFIHQARDGRKPYLFTLELTPEEIMMRISCMISGVSWNDAQKGNLMPAEWKKMTKAHQEFSQYQYWVEMPPVDERTVPSLLLKADKMGAESIFISQFRYIRGLKDFYRSEHEESAEIAVDLKRAAARPGAERPVIVEAQFNRGGDSMDDLEDFDASKVGLTDMIPQSADVLYGLFENKDLRSNNLSQFGILEARNHDKGAWTIYSDLVNKTEFRLQQRI